MAAVAAAGPPELVASIKSTLAAGLAVTSAEDAVDLELMPQVESTRRPAFGEFVGRLQPRLADRYQSR